MTLFSLSILQLISLILSYLSSRNIFSLLFLSTLCLSSNFIGALFLSNFCVESCLTPLYISLGTFSLVLGAFIMSKFTETSIRNRIRSDETEIRYPKGQSKIFFYTLSIVTFFCLILALLLFIKKGIPLLSEDIETARQLVFRNAGFYYRTVRFSLPFLSILWMSYAFYIQKKTIKAAMVFVVLLSAIFLLFAGYKGIVFGFALLILMFLSIKLKKSFKKIAILTLILFFGLASIVYVTYVTQKSYNTSFIQSVQFIFSRLTTIAVEGFYIIVNNFLPQEGLQYGKTIINGLKDFLAVLRLVPREEIEEVGFGVFLMRWAWGYNPLNYAYTVTVFGDFLANFGLPGLIILSFLFGIFIQKLYIATLKYSKDIFIFPSLIFLQWILFNIVERGSIDMATTFDLFSFLLIFIIFISIFIVLSLPTGVVKYKFYRLNLKRIKNK